MYLYAPLKTPLVYLDLARYVDHGKLHQLLLELKDPLGAAGNYATAGKFASMLKSEPDFDFSFTMVRQLTN